MLRRRRACCTASFILQDPAFVLVPRGEKHAFPAVIHSFKDLGVGSSFDPCRARCDFRLTRLDKFVVLVVDRRHASNKG